MLMVGARGDSKLRPHGPKPILRIILFGFAASMIERFCEAPALGTSWFLFVCIGVDGEGIE